MPTSVPSVPASIISLALVLIGHHRAHSPIMTRAKEIIDAGTLGKLVGIMGKIGRAHV